MSGECIQFDGSFGEGRDLFENVWIDYAAARQSDEVDILVLFMS
ncbi:hypothetical protein CCP2SC5_280037 [Azospirillaceae bacterium]